MNEKSFNKAYDQGFRAFQSGVNITRNPYLIESNEAKEWAAGWEDAANEDLDSFEEENYDNEI